AFDEAVLVARRVAIATGDDAVHQVIAAREQGLLIAGRRWRRPLRGRRCCAWSLRCLLVFRRTFLGACGERDGACRKPKVGRSPYHPSCHKCPPTKMTRLPARSVTQRRVGNWVASKDRVGNVAPVALDADIVYT